METRAVRCFNKSEIKSGCSDFFIECEVKYCGKRENSSHLLIKSDTVNETLGHVPSNWSITTVFIALAILTSCFLSIFSLIFDQTSLIHLHCPDGFHTTFISISNSNDKWVSYHGHND